LNVVVVGERMIVG